MKIITLVFLLIMGVSLPAQNNLNIIPMPVEVKMGKGVMVINNNTTIVIEGHSLEKIASLFNDYLEQSIGYKLKITNKNVNVNAIVFNLKKPENEIEDGYNLIINKNGVYISSDNAAGVFWGMQTLLQLLPIKKERNNFNQYQFTIPQLSINDYPRFSYRGMHLDVSRHFMPISVIKKFIDYLATYKFNTFHWHLTDDQGWRIEIKKYPLLTEVGGYRNGTIIGRYPGKGNDSLQYGGFYSQEQIKEVVEYATDRYITIIPEIEMPGHSSAAIAAYPELSCFPDEDTKYPKQCVWAGPTKGKQVQQTWGVFQDVFCPSEFTFSFLQDVLDEVMALFPSPYIHIGGDECPKDSWKRSSFCQQLIKEKELKDEHELQSYFIQRIEKYINSKGKKIIGWDEILEGGLAPNATVMSWRGEAGGITAAKQHHNVIMTPEYPLYLNHSQTKNEDSVTQGGYNPLEAVYSYEPVSKQLTDDEGKYILGAQGNIWSEYIKSQSKLEYSIFPRMVALAEVLWTPKTKKNWKNFERRLPVIFERLLEEKTNYSRTYFDLKSTVLATADHKGLLWELTSACDSCDILLKEESPVADSVSLFISGTTIYYSKPIKFESFGTQRMTAYLVKNKKDTLSKSSINLNFNKATGKKITLTTPPSSTYPGDGAFTLVNGVQNEKGLARSTEFVGFKGQDCEAIIDLGKIEKISIVKVHTINLTANLIWRPLNIEVFGSDDGINFTTLGITNDFIKGENGNGTMISNFAVVGSRYLKIKIKNWGTIPEGNSGAGKPAWLFVDEIVVE